MTPAGLQATADAHQRACALGYYRHAPGCPAPGRSDPPCTCGADDVDKVMRAAPELIADLRRVMALVEAMKASADDQDLDAVHPEREGGNQLLIGRGDGLRIAAAMLAEALETPTTPPPEPFYYLLSRREFRNGEETCTWWGYNHVGLVGDLASAGKYRAADVPTDTDQVCAIECEIVDALAVPMVDRKHFNRLVVARFIPPAG